MHFTIKINFCFLLSVEAQFYPPPPFYPRFGPRPPGIFGRRPGGSVNIAKSVSINIGRGGGGGFASSRAGSFGKK